jgi:TPR repeat protein
MLGHRVQIIGLLAGLLLAGPVLAAPSVVVLGGGNVSDDPVAACGDLAASPWEAGRDGRGLADEQVFIDGAIAACEAAWQASPDSVEVETWLARAYILAGRRDEAVTLLDAATNAGNPFAAYLLARLLGTTLDNTVAQDPDRAIALLTQAADGGFAPAQVDLGERYEVGNGVPGDYTEAERLYQLASDQGQGLASYKLGLFAHYGYLAEADYDRATELYRRAADAGEPLGNYGLGQLHEYGNGVEQDYSKAAEFYQLAADGKEKMAETALAYLYEQGLGVAQDYDKSFALLIDASAQNWGFAHAALSIHYLFGQGTPVDESKAYDLAWAAQRLGVTYAEGILGYMFQNGLGTVRDLSSAKFHYQDGANGGDQYSADQIPTLEAEIACDDAAGSPYEPSNSGHGRAFLDIVPDEAIPACENAVTLNATPVGNRVWLARAYARAERYEDAVPLLEEGVAANNVLAHTVLGDLLLAGSGIERDPKRAIALYEAVARDFGLAQYTLGLLYAEGYEVPQDDQQALHWLRLAESFGVAEATDEITAVLAKGEGGADSIDLTGFGREGPAY